MEKKETCYICKEVTEKMHPITLKQDGGTSPEKEIMICADCYEVEDIDILSCWKYTYRISAKTSKGLRIEVECGGDRDDRFDANGGWGEWNGAKLYEVERNIKAEELHKNDELRAEYLKLWKEMPKGGDILDALGGCPHCLPHFEKCPRWTRLLEVKKELFKRGVAPPI